jgi:hypothetical protein
MKRALLALAAVLVGCSTGPIIMVPGNDAGTTQPGADFRHLGASGANGIHDAAADAPAE